jgi:hypothetical protein
MNYCHETTKMGGPLGNRPAVARDGFRTVPEWYVAGADTRDALKDGHIRGPP